MHLRHLSIISLIFLAACSVYESSGRKSFESNAPDNIQRASSSAVDENSEADALQTCWTQPKQEPLWHVADNSLLTVREINPEEIQVCFEEAP
jgi:hypothetical protein